MFTKMTVITALASCVLGAAGTPLAFEINRGQFSPEVRFVARGEGLSAFLTSSGAVLAMHKSEAVIRIEWLGGNPAPQLAAENELPGKANYFVGDADLWRTGLPTYGAVRYRAVYPGIDAIYHGEQHQFEYDFAVAPGGDPARIRVAFEGASSVDVDADGNLLLNTPGGIVRHHKPIAYQKDRRIEARYILRGNHVAFALGPYDHTRELIIDPVVSFATYAGGKVSDIPHGVAVDAAGNAYVTGETTSADFPSVKAVYAAQGATDVFVAKYSPDGSTLLYSTFIGGTGHDLGTAIAVDANGNAYVAGRTASANFPTLHAVQSAFGGTEDAFVLKLNAAGSALLYSTFLGGKLTDQAQGVAVDPSGNAFVTGYTVSTDFPTMNPFQSGRAGGYDVFVSKLDPSGSNLIYSTYFGGVQDDYGRAIAIDPAGNAYITGLTGSPNFPIAHALQPKLNPSGDAFVAKLDPSGHELVYSTYLGGGGLDDGAGIAADSCGYAYVSGKTQSTNFPTTPNAVQATFAGPNSAAFAGDAFYAKIDPAGAALSYSTYLGGTKGETGAAIALDAAGNVYVAGATASPDFPASNASQAQHGGGACVLFPCGDAFVSKFSLDGSSMIYSTFLGGSKDDAGMAMSVHASGAVWMAGLTLSDDLPTVKPLQRARAVSSTSTSSPDAFVARIDHPLEIAADLSITQSGATDPVKFGDNFVYILTVSNAGPATATGTLITDTLPDTVTFVSAAPADQCALAGNTVQCNLADLAKGNSVQVQITVQGTLAGAAVNTAAVTSNVPDAFQCNNTSTMTGTILDPPPAPVE
jgi:uncharacterized repeat protein (TIGR01451 family)